MNVFRAAPALVAAVLLGCADHRVNSARAPLYPAAAVTDAQPTEITFLLPGALTTARIFQPAQDWASPTHRVIEYRLPGMEGEPVAPPLDIIRSATWIADYANRFPKAKINLLGYSTGAAIAIEASGRITDGKRVRVAAVSSPTPFPGAAFAAVRGAISVTASAFAVGSFDKQKVWEDYYKTLYFGPGWRRSETTRAAAAKLEDIVKGRVLPPGDGVVRAQSGKLVFWAPSPAALGSGARITFFHGARDPVFPLRSIRRFATRLGADLCVLPKDGHLVFQSNSDIILQLESFFSGAEDRGTCRGKS